MGPAITDDRGIYERLTLEAFQSGLSWLTILRKRENFREAFDGFDFERVAEYGDRESERLLADAGIVRNRVRSMLIASTYESRQHCQAISSVDGGDGYE